jgi:hypothetical protein
MATLRLVDKVNQHILSIIAEMPLDCRVDFEGPELYQTGADEKTVFVDPVSKSSWFVNKK